MEQSCLNQSMEGRFRNILPRKDPFIEVPAASFRRDSLENEITKKWRNINATENEDDDVDGSKEDSSEIKVTHAMPRT